MTETLKTCTKCNRAFPYPCFKKRSDKPDKYRAQCRECDNAYLKIRRQEPEFKEREKQSAKVYRDKNKEKRSNSWKAWHERNLERRKEYRQRWRERKNLDPDWVEKQRKRSHSRYLLEKSQCPERVLVRKTRYRDKHREELRRKGRVYYRQNREEIALRKKYYDSTVRGKTARRLIRQRYLARKKNADGYCSPQEWQAICSQYGWKCYLCGCVLTVESVTMDHKIPLSKRGTNYPSNLAPCCSTCNCRKHNKTEAEYRALLATQLPL